MHIATKKDMKGPLVFCITIFSDDEWVQKAETQVKW